MSQESTGIKAAEERQAKRLDADYSKDWDERACRITRLLDRRPKKSELLQALKSYPTLFGGGLGKLNIEPIRLKLKEGANACMKRQLEKRSNDSKNLESGSELATPNGAPPRLSNRRKRAMCAYLHTFANSTSSFIKGVKWATAIDLSMGYYHIPMDEYSQGLLAVPSPSDGNLKCAWYFPKYHVMRLLGDWSTYRYIWTISL